MKKNKIYFLLAIFSFFMFHISSISALEINAEDYATFKEAIADETVTKITLSNDIVVTDDPGVVIASGRNILLDLNGKILSMESDKAATSYLINNKGSLTIKDSSDVKKDGSGTGKIIFSSSNPDLSSSPKYASDTIVNNGTIVLESGLIENDTKKTSAAYVIDNNSSASDAVINIKGGKINSVYNWGIRMFANSTTKNNDVTMEDGFINGGLWIQTLRNQSKANLTVNNGTLKGASYALYVYDPYDGANVNVIINNGNFIADDNKGYAIYDFNTNANLEINGGTFTAYTAYLYFTYNSSDKITHKINGGTFNGYVQLSEKFNTNPDEEFSSNFTIKNGKFLKDVYVRAYDGKSWYYATNTKIISGGEFATILDGEYDCLWPWLVVSPYTATGVMKTTTVGYPYTIGHKITLNSNYEDDKNVTIYTLTDGSMSELENCFERAGYNFLGWNTKSDGSGNEIKNTSKLNSDTNLYAIWKITPGDITTNVSSEKIDIVVDEKQNLNDLLLTEEEKESVENGKNIKIDVIVNDISEQVPLEDKESIKEQIQDKSIGAYIDISILKTVEGESVTHITNTNKKLKFTLNLPENLLNTASTNRKFYIVRVHDNIVELLDTVFDSTNNTLTFETDKFSTYAIAYTDENINQKNSTNPKTYDAGINKNIFLLITCILGIVGTTLYLKKSKN